MSKLHLIETNPVPDRYARGWHCLGKLENYKDGKAHTIEAFGTKLVAFQGEDGNVHILDAYCPHMGADIHTPDGAKCSLRISRGNEENRFSDDDKWLINTLIPHLMR
ncbi:Rieske 2Fe-2S domain-containing protein, partial [Endozoicomonas atrinae]|uniref:Rieske 2Fe-2S domain-containing protein n=1 Tax=Endozoicomonas atrinae TaxID=1333660 RepID=UPI000ADB3ABD